MKVTDILLNLYKKLANKQDAPEKTFTPANINDNGLNEITQIIENYAEMVWDGNYPSVDETHVFKLDYIPMQDFVDWITYMDPDSIMTVFFGKNGGAGVVYNGFYVKLHLTGSKLNMDQYSLSMVTFSDFGCSVEEDVETGDTLITARVDGVNYSDSASLHETMFCSGEIEIGFRQALMETQK